MPVGKQFSKPVGKHPKSIFSKGSVIAAIIGGALFAVGHIIWIAFITAAVIFLVIAALLSSFVS